MKTSILTPAPASQLKVLWKAPLAALVVAVSACNERPDALSPDDTLALASSEGPGVRSTNQVLILGSSVAGGLQSREAQAVATFGWGAKIEVATPEQWRAMTATQFMEYRALIIGDAACQSGTAAFQAAEDTRNTWGKIVDGNVALLSTDPVTNRTNLLVENAINFVLDSVQGRTGLYAALGCAYQNAPANTPVPLLEAFGTFKVQGVPGCAGAGHVFQMYSDLMSQNLWDAALPGRGCAARSVFTEYPDHTFAFAALAMSSTGAAIPGQRIYPDYLYEPEMETPFMGTPYVLVRGAMPLSSGCGLTEEPPGEQCDNGDGLNGQPALPGELPWTTCSFSCHLNWCGDGAVDTAFGEECDNGNRNGRSGDAAGTLGTCSSFCKLTQTVPPSRPPNALCRDVSLVATNTCGLAADINNGSNDPDGDLVGCIQNPPGPYAIGATAVMLTCTDQAQNQASCLGTVTVTDRVAPTVALLGPSNQVLECIRNQSYADPGATASDLCDGLLPDSRITRSGSVSLGTPSTYPLTYTATDPAGNKGTATRTVVVSDTLPPTLALTGSSNMALECGTPWADPGATANDQCAGDLTSQIQAIRTGNPSQPGTFTVRYKVTDPAGHETLSATQRTVTVNDSKPPTLALVGPASTAIECGTAYSDPGATAQDACFGDVSSRIQQTGSVNTGVPGSYGLTFSVTDPAGQSAPPVQRTVAVRDTQKPSVTVLGPTSVTLECGGGAYSDPGASATDSCAGTLPAVPTLVADPSTPGTYVITYRATDPSGNVGVSSTGRTVTVSDTLAPTLTLQGNAQMGLECLTVWIDPGATASDQCDGNLPVQISGTVNPKQLDTYSLRYRATDRAGHTLTQERRVTVMDSVPPVITVLGPVDDQLECGSSYVDPGANAYDACADTAVPVTVTRSGNPSQPGNFTLTYSATDPSNNSATSPVVRTVHVHDDTPPTLSLVGSATQTLECGTAYADPGATAQDTCFGDMTQHIQTTGAVNSGTPGSYVLTYGVTDPAGQSATPAQRTVNVRDTVAPSLTVLGPLSHQVQCDHAPYADPGATASDTCAGDLTDAIVATGTVNTGEAGSYTLRYRVADPSGNTTESANARTVTVVDGLPPEFQLVGPASAQQECGSPYADPGATAQDACAGDLTGFIARTGSVNTATPGTYALSYRVSDPSHLTASVERSVTVADTLPPELSLQGDVHPVIECGSSLPTFPATATDACSGNLDSEIYVSGSVNPSVVGSYVLTYEVADGAGNAAPPAQREVQVRDTTPPTLSIQGPLAPEIQCGSTYVDPGATATDSCAGDLTSAIEVTRTGNPNQPGALTITYSVRDPSGNRFTSPVVRTVTVRDDTAPTLALLGPATQTLECGMPYADPGATASDVCFGELTASVSRSGTLNPNEPGDYALAYTVTDGAGNTAPPAERLVQVRDTEAPTLTVQGPLALSYECGTTYVDPGATASDRCAGDLTTLVEAIQTAAPDSAGDFTLTYRVTDPSGNTAVSPVSRTVTMLDHTPPALALNGPAMETVECGTPYRELGATALDACAGDLSGLIQSEGSVDTAVPGTYTLRYSVSDPSGQTAARSRTVRVDDTQAPRIQCPEPLVTEVVEGHLATVTPGQATATDSCDAALRISAPDQTLFPPGTTTLTYTALDASGNTASCDTTVTVMVIPLPDTFIVARPPDETLDTSARFEFGSSKSNVTYECSLGGSEFAECAQSTLFRELTEGGHLLRVRARDSMGNVDPTPAEGTWKVLPWDEAVIGGGQQGCAVAGDEPSAVAMLGLALVAAVVGSKRRLSRQVRRTLASVLGVAVPLASAPVLAEPRSLPSFEMERLSLNPGASGSLLLGTGELLPEGVYRLSLTTHYEHNPLVFIQNGLRMGAVIRYRATAHLAAAYGVKDFLELGVQVPLLLAQRGDDLTARGLLSPETGPALGTPFLTVHGRLLSQQQDDPVDLSVGLQAGPKVGRAGALARELRAIPSVMVGRRYGFLRAALDAGLLLRPRTVLTQDSKIQDELGYALRLGAGLSTTEEGVRVEAALIGAVPLRREGSSIEALAGLRVPLNPAYETYAMAGLGYGSAPGTPDFRVLVGLAYVRTPPACFSGGQHDPGDCPDLDDDEDGVENRDDACPLLGGPVDPRGCPLEDSDSDGLMDPEDRCPAVAGIPALRGCPEPDLDGQDVSRLQCPGEAAGASPLGCSPPDSDGDGLLDGDDECPWEPGPLDRHGCPFKDKDGDGTEDALDNCPCDKGPASNEGCPEAEPQLVAIEKGRIDIKEHIHFELNKDAVHPSSYPLLNQMADVINEHPEVFLVSIDGHTDDWGTNAYNLGLSQRRAASVRDYLISQGVAPERLEARGFGEEQPLKSNATAEGRAANRRVEFLTHTRDGKKQ